MRFHDCPECGKPGQDNPSGYCSEHEKLYYWPPRQIRTRPEPRRIDDRN